MSDVDQLAEDLWATIGIMSDDIKIESHENEVVDLKGRTIQKSINIKITKERGTSNG